MTTAYDRLGGEEGVRTLVDTFYDLMDTLPATRTIRSMHARDLRVSREKLFLFLSGWLGGPNLYMEKFGHPRLRARHLPFAIGEAEREQWLLCMNRALEELGVEPDLRRNLSEAFQKMADHMQNQYLSGSLGRLAEPESAKPT